MTTAELTTFYNGKRVLVTGHTGFKGAWLITLLERLGAVVQGYALAAEQPALYRDIQGDQLCQSTIGDLLDKTLLKQTVVNFEPEVVFHLAAQPLVIEAYKDPVYTFEVNAIGTANLLEAIRNLPGACTVINITTDKVYDNKEWYYPYRENDALGGYDPYSASKACAELVTASYRSSFFNPAQYEQHQTALATVRAGNVIGGGDWAANRLIPDIVRAVQAGDEVVLRNPEAVRPWQHVLEALYGYLILGKLLAEHPLKYGTAYNFGPLLDEAVSVEYLVQQAIQSWGRGSYRVERPENAVHEAQLLRLDCSKATQELQWKPKWNATEAIEQTIEWYRLVLDEEYTPLEVTRSQLSTYLL
ncbi:MAG: CDP-glucose 4,6-dehydratase [Aureispira sp.]